MPRLPAVVAGAALLLLAGCTSGPSNPTPTSSAPASAPVSAPPSPAPSSPAACPDGRYRITSIESRSTSLGTGQGGNIDFTFTDGTFTIASDGSGAVKVDLGPAKADLRVNGEIRGTYDGPPDALQLAVTGSTGKATIQGLGVNRSFSTQTLADQLIGSKASGSATCTPDGARLALPQATLVLARS